MGLALENAVQDYQGPPQMQLHRNLKVITYPDQLSFNFTSSLSPSQLYHRFRIIPHPPATTRELLLQPLFLEVPSAASRRVESMHDDAVSGKHCHTSIPLWCGRFLFSYLSSQFGAVILYSHGCVLVYSLTGTTWSSHATEKCFHFVGHITVQHQLRTSTVIHTHSLFKIGHRYLEILL